MSYNGGDTITVRKAVGRADTKKAIREMAVDPTAKWWVGHVRYATHGSPSELRNDHPITHGDIIGVHNGVIRNHAEILAETGREDPKTEVDSEAIFAAVNKWGHAKGLDKVKGDMVAVYIDRRYPLTIRIARTAGRPILMCRTPTGAIVFASEEGCIEATGIEHSRFSNVTPYRLLNIKEGRITKRTDLVSDFQVRAPHLVPTSNGINPANWRRPHYSETPGTEHLSPQAESMRQRIIRQAKRDEDAAKDMQRMERVRHPLQQNEKAPEDGFCKGNLYFYQDAWYDMDSYMDLVLGEYA